MIFEILFLAGAAGIAIMAMMGFVHVGAHHGIGHAGHGHSGIGHHGHAALGHGHATTAHAPATQGSGARGLRSHQGMPIVHDHPSPLAFVPTPLDLFSMAMGAGLAGMIFRSMLSGANLVTAAIVGAILFNFAIVRPMMALMFRFASKPSEGLEGLVALPAEAITKFDASGKGLVRINMEGQVIQLLAKLAPEEIERGVTIQKGDEVVVTEVNPKASTCNVTRDLSS